MLLAPGGHKTAQRLFWPKKAAALPIMVAFVLPPRGQVAPVDGPMSMFRRYSQGEEDEVKRDKTRKLPDFYFERFQSDKTNGLCRINPVTKTGQRLYMVS